MVHYFQDFIINTIIFLQGINISYSIIIVILSSLILYSFPIPGSIILFFHIIIFGLYGFFTSIFCATLSSLILYSFFKKKIKLQKYNKFFFLNSYIENIYVLTVSRIFIPFPICTYLFIFFKITFKKFFVATILGIIPGTLSLSLLINSIKNNILLKGEFNISIFNDPIFILSIFMIVVLIFLSSKFKKKFKI